MRKDRPRIPGTLLRRGAAIAVLGLIPLVGGPIAGLAQEGYATDEFWISRRDGEQIGLESTADTLSGRIIGT